MASALILLIPLLLSAEPLRGDELAVGLSGVGSSYSFRGGAFGDFSLGPDVQAQGVWSGFTADASGLVAVPTDAMGAATSTTLTLRLGYTWERVQLLAGAAAQYSVDARPSLQLLPSLRAEVAFTRRLRFSAALFEHHALAPVELAWQQERFYLGYLPPLGGSFGLRLPLGGEVSLSVGALAFRLYDATVGMVTVAGVLGERR